MAERGASLDAGAVVRGAIVRTLLLLLLLLGAGCGGTEIVYIPSEAGPCDASTPGDAGSDLELCAAGREAQYPCITKDGASLRHGECCVQDGNLGYCFPDGEHGEPLKIPWCNTKL